MSDYYEPHPRLLLERPFVLGGAIGCGTRLIGRILCARTGLPFVEVDRQIEHEAGCELARIAEFEGAAGVSERAAAVLERVATRSPFAVVALDHAWPHARVVGLLARDLDLVRIERPADYLLERTEREILQAGRWVLGGVPLVIRNASDLAFLSAQRESLLGAARRRIDAGADHEHRVAERLLEGLESAADGGAP